MRRRKNWIPLLILWLTFFAACRAPESLRDQAKAQRLLNRIERLDPSALTYSTDTVFEYVTIQDTFFVESRQYDTTFAFLPGDTVTLTDTVSRIVTRIIFRDGSASLSLSIPKDTLIIYDTIEFAVSINHSIEIEKKPWYGFALSLWRTSKWLLIVLAVALIGLFVWRTVK